MDVTFFEGQLYCNNFHLQRDSSSEDDFLDNYDLTFEFVHDDNISHKQSSKENAMRNIKTIDKNEVNIENIGYTNKQPLVIQSQNQNTETIEICVKQFKVLYI